MELDEEKSSSTASSQATKQRNLEVNYYQQPSEAEEEKDSVTLGDLWHMIAKHWKGLLVSFVVCVLVGLIYGFAIKKPEWSSTGTVAVLADSGNSSSTETTTGIDSTNLSLSITLVPSVTDFMNSDPIKASVANQINEKWGTTYTTNDIGKFVSASAKTYTSLEKSVYITITATTSKEELSQDLVNAVMQTSIEMANDTEANSYSKIFANSIYISSQASEAIDSSMSKALILAIAAGAGVVIGALYGIIFELCSTKVGTAKELENLTGVKVIGTIPDISKGDEKNSKKKNKEDK